MKCLLAGFFALSIVSFISSQPSAQAQTSVGPTRPPGYDISKEVTFSGTVSSVLTKHSPGMIMGSHLLLATISGPVDASLGVLGLRGRGALSVAAGQQVEVTGVMKTIQDKQVLLTRSVKVGGQVYTMRNEHGVPVPPQARARAQKGESL